MNISFTQKQQNYIRMQIASGDYQNASEVVRDAIRIHQAYRSRIIDDLKRVISSGWEGEASTLNVASIVKKKVIESKP